MKRLLWLVLALSLAAVCLVASPPSPVSIDRASAAESVTIRVDFNYTGMVKETTGASYDAKPSSLSAADKAAVIAKIKEKWEDALGAGKVTVEEGAAGTGDLSVIVTDTDGPGTKYGNAGDDPAAAIVYEGFFRKEGFTGTGLTNAIGESSAHELGHRAGLDHTENKADLMSAGGLVPMADREADTRPFTTEQKDALKTWLKGLDKSKPKASGKATDFVVTPLMQEAADNAPDETAADLNLTLNGFPSGTQFGYMNIDNKFFSLGTGPIITITDFTTPYNFAVRTGDGGQVCDAATGGTLTFLPGSTYPFGANTAKFSFRCPSQPAGDVQLGPLADHLNPFALNGVRNFPGALQLPPATVFGAYPDSNLEIIGVGDFNGDGVKDILAGTRYSYGLNNNQFGAGEVDIIFGRAGPNPFPQTVDLLQPGNNVLRIFGSSPLFYLGPIAEGRLNSQGPDDFILSAEGADANGAGSGAVYVFFGGPTITAGSFTINQFLANQAANSFQIHGPLGSHLGRFVAIGDVTGDGVADLIAGAAVSDAPGAVLDAGNVYVYKGPFLPGTTVVNPFASYYGDSANTFLGSFPPVIFDQHIFFPAPQADNVNGIDAGTVYGFPLPLTGNTGASIGTAPVQIYGAGAGDFFGFGAVGIPADGSTPGYLAIGAPGFSPYRSQPSDCQNPPNAPPGVRCSAGAVYLFQSPLSGHINLANGGANFVIYGRARGDGINPSSAGDVNGDGHTDLFISETLGSGPGGASNNAGEGDIFFSGVFVGSQALTSAADATPSTQVIDLASNPQSMTILGRDANDFLFCCKVADVNGDGLPDLLASATGGAGPNNDRAAAGEGYVILSHPRGDVRCDGALDAGDALAIALVSVGLSPAQPAQVAGSCTAIGAAGSDGLQGDLNCDGVVDLTDMLDDLRVFAGLSPLATAGPCPGSNAPVFGG